MKNRLEMIGQIDHFHSMFMMGTKSFDKDKEYKLTIELYNKAKEKSLNQNNLFQSLAREFYVSGFSSVPDRENEEWIKGSILCRVGWIKEYIYVNSFDEILRSTIKPTNFRMAKPVAKSWGNIGVSRATEAINLLIADMRQSECNTKKFDEIMSGAEGEYNA